MRHPHSPYRQPVVAQALPNRRMRPGNPTYAARAGALSPETTWTLRPHGLAIESKARQHLVPYAEIREIRLEPAGNGSCLCHLEPAHGRRITIPSTHFVRLASFEDRRAQYVPWILELIRQVAAANPACAYRTGTVAWQYYSLAVLVVLIVAFLAWASDPGRFQIDSASTWIRIAAAAFLISMAAGFLRHNRPGEFTPDAVPEHLLPPL